MLISKGNQEFDILNHKYLLIKQSKLHSETVKISGYRHSSNLLLAASIIVPESHITLHNMPNLLDTYIGMDILIKLGADCTYEPDILNINTKNLFSYEVPNYLSEQTHGSLYLMPALLARFGKCIFGKSGGCQIGDKNNGFDRPIDHILDVMQKFSASIHRDNERYVVSATKLQAAVIDIMDYSYDKHEVIGPLTSGATKTAILLALSIKEGKTVLLNPFLKSETIDLLHFIQALGYKVFFDPQKIEIMYDQPKKKLDYYIISDPSEIITYMCLAAYHEIKLTLSNITLEKTLPILQPELDLFNRIKLPYKIENEKIIVGGTSKTKSVQIDITSRGICTDHHPLLILCLLKADGTSKITEHVWHDRFNYIPETNKFGLNLQQDKNSILIFPKELDCSADIISCPDLRAAALLTILSLGAPGQHFITNHYHLCRGYVNLITNLKNMGGLIEGIDEIL